MSGLAGKGRVVISECVTATWGAGAEAGAVRDCAFGCALLRASSNPFGERESGEQSVPFLSAGKYLGALDMECSWSELCNCSGLKSHFGVKHNISGSQSGKVTEW